MKKLLLSAVLVFLGLFAVQANVSNYFVDHAALDVMFEQAEQVDMFSMNAMAPLASTNATVVSEPDAAIAFILAWFVGPLGIHRAYLGTSTGTIIAYILTLGGCGIVAFVDWVVLLIGLVNNDISNYVDNPSFFMW